METDTHRSVHINSLLRLGVKAAANKRGCCHFLFLSMSLTFPCFSILCEHAAVLISHPISWVPWQMFPLYSIDQLFAFFLRWWCAAKAGQSGCETLPWGKCVQVFKVFQCKFRVPVLFTEPISGTVVKEGLHCRGPVARVKTWSVLWSLVSLC